MTYLWERADWPAFSWTNSALLEALVRSRHEQGRLLALEQNFVHSYEVSELKKDLFADLFIAGLNDERLRGWQASLFPTGYAGIKKIRVGDYRNKDYVRSSLPLKNLHVEISRYLHWWTDPPVEIDPFIRAALGFFWFYCISPFDKGNFTLACALAEKVLNESEKLSFRAYDLSLQLEENKDAVVALFKSTIIGTGDLTEWLLFFIEQIGMAISSSLLIAQHKVSSEAFWKKISVFDLNKRQRKILNMLFDENVSLTNRRYVEICKTSRESAKRDLSELCKLGILQVGNKKGRSVSYTLT